MPDAVRSLRVAVVTGDVTMDWHLARRRLDGAAAWNARAWSRMTWQRGGAALLADLIEALIPTLPEGAQGWAVRQTAAPREPVGPGDARFHHAYAAWCPCKYGERPPEDREKPAWRVEEFLGLDRSPQEAADWQRVVDDTPSADLVVLDDDNLGFRDRPELWPQAISDRRRQPWIVLKMAWPVAQGPLWEHLQQHFAGRLIVLTTIDDLRRTEVQISRGLSWERTAQDIAWELVYNPRVNALARAAHVVLSFDTAGAMLLSRRSEGDRARGKAVATPEAWLFFDPQVTEGQWEQNYPGGMVGYATCLAAGTARQVMRSPRRPSMAEGIQAGLRAMRKLHREGYGDRQVDVAGIRLAFPHQLVASELARDDAPLAKVAVQDPSRFLVARQADEKAPKGGLWTILHDRYADSLVQVAERIVLVGAEVALQGVPLGQFGALLTVDRREIESLRSIRALVGEYSQSSQKRPLSIAVFGPPGAGKSFGITQMARSLLPGRTEVLEFNLSQLTSPGELGAALHRVRDVGLGGKMPLVFWDEFDTPLAGNRLGWLRYFLAPMQDGAFREGQVVHPIGRAIFVFAGGTCHRFAEFGRGLDAEEFRAAKGPDFSSRLKGYVDVLGPDPQRGDDDPYYVIRRAILLRSILQRNTPQLLHKSAGRNLASIDPGVLRAFLEILAYRHGVRSMEAIVAMSMLAGKATYERSSLPSEAQLDLHVDGASFLALVQQIDLEGETLERLAAAAHEVFCEEMLARGYRFGPKIDETQKVHSALRPYAELPEEEKEQNCGNVRDIPQKLALAGYLMLPARSNERPLEFPGDDLERLSQMEHERWLKAKLAAGWHYGPKTDRATREHASIVPWEELSEEQKDKDRVLVREIPRILARAGYATVRLDRGRREHQEDTAGHAEGST